MTNWVAISNLSMKNIRGICDRESEVMDAIRDSITDEKTRKLLFELDELHGGISDRDV